MSRFARDEVIFWVAAAKRYAAKDDRIIEMGCGTGRLLRPLQEKGFSVYGFDDDPLLVAYCKKRRLKVFQLDALKKIPAIQKHKYKIAGIAQNTLFNFPKKLRKQWIAAADDLLSDDGVLIISAYADVKFSNQAIEERVEFYKDALTPGKEESIVVSKGLVKGIGFIGKDKQVKFFSAWVKKKDLITEINTWKKFKIRSFTVLPSGIAYAVVLVKKIKSPA